MVVSNAPQQPTENCTHERRPGTTVCLHCRHEARMAAQVRRQRIMLRGGAGAVVVAIFGVAALLSARTLRGRSAKAVDTTQPVTQVAEASVSDTQPMTPAARVVQEGEVARHALAPVLKPGETSFGDGVTAVRTDTGVVLSFDTPTTRTRIPEKFEHFVRATLPRIYGPPADSALARVAAGGIAGSQQQLLNELPTRGLHLPLADGKAIVLYPETRPGQDGPLVVRYRVSVVSPD
jgi:hypothetical protein